MTLPDFAQANAYALTRLAQELAPQLAYHSIVHTRDDVVPAATRLAALEGVAALDTHLLETAAYFHDLGFVEIRVGHEAVSVRLAQEVLPGFGFTPAQVTLVAGIIWATMVPQNAKTLLEKIMADADLDVLGREDFWPRNEALRAELAAYDSVFTDAGWYAGQLRFMQNHQYFTAAARQLREARKQQHIHEMQTRLQATEAIHP